MNMMMGGGPMAPKSTSMAMNPRFVVMYLHGTRSKIFSRLFIQVLLCRRKKMLQEDLKVFPNFCFLKCFS